MRAVDKHIVLLPGDGIGPEIVRQGAAVLRQVAGQFGHRFTFEERPIGGCAVDACGAPLPGGTLAACQRADAVLLGAVGGPKWDALEPERRPEQGLLALRAGLGLYANLRPALLSPALVARSPLKSDRLAGGLDVLIVRELTGDVYFGEKSRVQTENGETGRDMMSYSWREVERIGRRAFAMARLRRGKVTSVDKANVLETSRVWRECMHQLAQEYPDVQYEDMYVDNAAMQLIANPRQFDVIVTGNLFGDILSDEASMLTGSIGLLPSASLGDGALGLYEPIHGSAPDLAGRNAANPAATILSCAMLLRYSFGLTREADAVERAVDRALADGCRTADLAAPGEGALGTEEMGQAICQRLEEER